MSQPHARKRGFFQVGNDLVDQHRTLSPSACKVYCVLARLADRTTGESRRSIARICYLADMSDKTLRRTLAELTERGLITVTERVSATGRTLTSVYTVLAQEGDETGHSARRPPVRFRRADAECRPAEPPNVAPVGGEDFSPPTPGRLFHPSQDSGNRQDSLFGGSFGNRPPSGGAGAHDQAQAREEPPDGPPIAPSGPPAHLAEWAQFLARYPKRSGDRGVKAAQAIYLRLRKRGVPAALLQDGVSRYAAWADATGKTGTELVKQIPTWLNGECWTEDWEIPPPTAPARTGGNGPRRTETFEEQRDRLLAEMRANREQGYLKPTSPGKG